MAKKTATCGGTRSQMSTQCSQICVGCDTTEEKKSLFCIQTLFLSTDVGLMACCNRLQHNTICGEQAGMNTLLLLITKHDLHHA